MFFTSKVAERQRHDELMDQPGLDEASHIQALQALGRVNLISRSGARLWPAIKQLAQGRSEANPLRVLDVASGGGDIAINLARIARRSGLCVQVDGCDISDQAVKFAQTQAESHGLSSRFFPSDGLGDALPKDYDIVTCTLFLHHLEPGDATLLLKNLGAAARQLVMVDDLIRSRLGYLLARVGVQLLSRSAIVHYDGPVSVQGAYTVSEAMSLALAAGLKEAKIVTHWPERFLLTWGRPQ